MYVQLKHKILLNNQKLDLCMDKILLTAFLSALAGFLTAVMNIVKLVNDKEGKTTDYRQSWTDSARKSLAELISNLNTQAAILASIAGSVESISKGYQISSNLPDGMSEEQKKKIAEHNDRLQKLVDGAFIGEQEAAREMRQAIYKSYAFTRLHFKPNDISFNRVEQKFDIIINLLRELGNPSSRDKKEDLKVLRERIHKEVEDLTGFARDILKTEWETVKKGEKAYQRTKFWSFVGGVFMLFILLSIGIHVYFIKESNVPTPGSQEQPERMSDKGRQREGDYDAKPQETSVNSTQSINNYVGCDRYNNPTKPQPKPHRNCSINADRVN